MTSPSKAAAILNYSFRDCPSTAYEVKGVIYSTPKHNSVLEPL